MSNELFIFNILGVVALYTTCLITFLQSRTHFWKVDAIILAVAMLAYLYINRKRHPLFRSQTLIVLCYFLCAIGLSLIVHHFI